MTKNFKSHQKNEHKIGKFIKEIIHCIKDIKEYKGKIPEMQPRLNEIKVELKGIREKMIAQQAKEIQHTQN